MEATKKENLKNDLTQILVVSYGAQCHIMMEGRNLSFPKEITTMFARECVNTKMIYKNE